MLPDYKKWRQQKQKARKPPETAEESKQATQPVKNPTIPIDNVPDTIPADKKRGRGRPSLKEKIAKSNTKMDQFYRRKVTTEQPVN